MQAQPFTEDQIIWSYESDAKLPCGATVVSITNPDEPQGPNRAQRRASRNR